VIPRADMREPAPYTGLRPFEYEDRAIFFGREKHSRRLGRLMSFGFIAVIGSSGSGKSSLVRAGLLPLLRDDGREKPWADTVMTPGAVDERGRTPIERLAGAIVRLSPTGNDELDRIRWNRADYLLRRSTAGIADALNEDESLEGRPVLIVVDQFEEVLRFPPREKTMRRSHEAQWREETGQFVQLLLGAYLHRPTTHVLITMRSDFIGDCARFPGLAEAVSDTQFLVPSLSREQRKEAIQGPLALARFNATIEAGLVERLLNDVGFELDQLPVLQHCLLRMWKHAYRRSPDRPALVMRDYDNVGQMRGALTQHADEVLNDLV
jgi:hypothetical protein